MLSQRDENKLEDCIKDVQGAIVSSDYFDDAFVRHNSFQDGYKVFVNLQSNLYSWKLFKEFQNRLIALDIHSEVCMYNTNKCITVWKYIEYRDDENLIE
jgi:hypothetical protein